MAEALPPEAPRGDATAVLLALTMFLVPTLGVPHEEMLQDTLKSMLVAFAALGAALLFFWRQRRAPALRWHAVLWLPLALMAYALGSMGWSHTYLAGVEAIRWFLFALLAWLALNTLTRERLTAVAWGIHAGAVGASLWAVLQFWMDLRLFPQGPNPASTFINRNFFAEYVVCALPFSMLLLARARNSSMVALLSGSTGLVITAILMTGTRAALIALWLQVLLVWPLVAWRCRAQLPCFRWSRGLQALAVGVLAGSVLALGSIPSGNPKLLEEGRGSTALQRGLVRTQSIGPRDESLGLRMVMWKATARLVQDRPFSGVGAGAWESEIPRYQAQGSQLETDYYVHNEFLQLVAEYGLVGWAFLALLAGWLARLAWTSWRDGGTTLGEELPWRAAWLCSLLMLFVVSNIGFPWRMAATGALFAVCLGALAASQARGGERGRTGAGRLPWGGLTAKVAVVGAAACLGLAAYISERAAQAESKLVQSAKLALAISASGEPNHPRWAATRAELLRLVREGIALNPHYRKITPLVGDELARWGNWKDAIWVWESVLQSRPYIVAVLGNVARGYASLGDFPRAMAYLERARSVQPRAPAVRSLEVVLLARMGQEPAALALARQAVDEGEGDYDLFTAAFVLGQRAGDYGFAARAMQARLRQWPLQRPQGFLQLGQLYLTHLRDPVRAEASFRQALAWAQPAQRRAVLAAMPAPYGEQLEGVAASLPPPGTPTQTSSSSR